jgi:hypothetical protein
LTILQKDDRFRKQRNSALHAHAFKESFIHLNSKKLNQRFRDKFKLDEIQDPDTILHSVPAPSRRVKISVPKRSNSDDSIIFDQSRIPFVVVKDADSED